MRATNLLICISTIVSLCAGHASAQSAFHCQTTSRLRVSSTSYAFNVDLGDRSTGYLRPNWRCELQVYGTSSSIRFLVSVEMKSLSAHGARVSLYDDISRQELGPLTSGSVFTDFLTKDEFTAKLITGLNGPHNNLARGARLKVRSFHRSNCPPNWTPFASYSRCYGSTLQPQRLTYLLARTACTKLAGQLASTSTSMGESTLLSHLNLLASRSQLDSSVKYWVGLVSYTRVAGVRGQNITEIKPLQASAIDCIEIGTCRCIAYWNRRLVTEDCATSHQFVCHYAYHQTGTSGSGGGNTVVVYSASGSVSGIVILILILCCCCVKCRSGNTAAQQVIVYIRS